VELVGRWRHHHHGLKCQGAPLIEVHADWQHYVVGQYGLDLDYQSSGTVVMGGNADCSPELSMPLLLNGGMVAAAEALVVPYFEFGAGGTFLSGTANDDAAVCNAAGRFRDGRFRILSADSISITRPLVMHSWMVRLAEASQSGCGLLQGLQLFQDQLFSGLVILGRCLKR
jgi:hypothetical protein